MSHPLVPVIRAWLLAVACVLIAFVWPELFLGVLPLIAAANTCSPCCSTGGDCNACNNGTCHTSYQVDIVGITDVSCGSCSGLNGTYVVTGACVGGSPCAWTQTISPSVCTIDNAVLTVSSVINTTAQFGLRSGVSQLWGWRKVTAGTKISCDLSAYDLPTTASLGTTCSHTSSTCTVNAL